MKKAAKELRSKSIQDMHKEVQTLRTEIARLKVEKKVKPQKDTNLIAKKQKRLAVVLTLINQQREQTK